MGFEPVGAYTVPVPPPKPCLYKVIFTPRDSASAVPVGPPELSVLSLRSDICTHTPFFSQHRALPPEARVTLPHVAHLRVPSAQSFLPISHLCPAQFGGPGLCPACLPCSLSLLGGWASLHTQDSWALSPEESE